MEKRALRQASSKSSVTISEQISRAVLLHFQPNLRSALAGFPNKDFTSTGL
jgi:hypothetical protein